MERIEPIQPPYSEKVQTWFDQIMGAGQQPLQLYRIVARNENVFGALVESGLLSKRGLLHTPRQENRHRELVILRTCARLGAGYEWGVHVAIFGKHSGLTASQIQATTRRDPYAVEWQPEQIALLNLVDSLIDTGTISDELWNRLSSYFDHAVIIEFMMLLALYQGVSYLANVSQVKPEPYAAPMPPDADAMKARPV